MLEFGKLGYFFELIKHVSYFKTKYMVFFYKYKKI